MKDRRGKVAVVTGAASGIGLALAKRLGADGMKVVLADVEAAALQQAAQELEKADIEVLPVVTDVAKAEQVQALADAALDAFGKVHVVCNNAGVMIGGLSWEAPLEDYEHKVHGARCAVCTPVVRSVYGYQPCTRCGSGTSDGRYTSGQGVTQRRTAAVVAAAKLAARERNDDDGARHHGAEAAKGRLPRGQGRRPDDEPSYAAHLAVHRSAEVCRGRTAAQRGRASRRRGRRGGRGRIRERLGHLRGWRGGESPAWRGW